MTELTLAQALNGVTRAQDVFTAPVAENWMQGRTTYGGYASALLLEAARRAVPDLPPLRSALINFVAPVTGDMDIRVEVLRQGRNITSVEARGFVGGSPAINGSFVFGVALASDIALAHPAPDAPQPAKLEPLIPPHAGRLAPRFHHNFEMLRIEGDLPMSGSDRAYLRCWARHRDPAAHDGIVPLFCIGDVLPPAVFPMFRRPGPNSSVTWMFNVLQDAPSTRDGWWHVETSGTAARDGYSSQVMRMWNADGELVADGMQSVIVFV